MDHNIDIGKPHKMERFSLESPRELDQWRQTLQSKSARMGSKLATIAKIEKKLAKRLEILNRTLAEEPMFVLEKSPKIVNQGPVRTLAEINTFHPPPESEAVNTNVADKYTFSKKEKDLKYDIEYHQDEELGFDISVGNEGVYVSNINDRGRAKGVILYSSLFALKNQNVTSFDVDKLKKALSTLNRPARITFRKSIVETPYGIGHIVDRYSETNPKVQILLEFGLGWIMEEDIAKFVPNKQWNEFEEERLSDLIRTHQSQTRNGPRSRNRNRNSIGQCSNSRPNTSGSFGALSRNNMRGKIVWEKIADEMHNRSAKDCEKRWELISTLNHLVNEDVLYNKLAYFSRKGDTQGAKRIVQRCPELLQRPDKNRSTPLFTACWYGKYEICKLMIAYGAKVNHSNLKGNYPIQMAIENSFVNIVDLLIANDAIVSIQDVYNLIDKSSTFNPHPDMVLSINRAQLTSGDKVWYEHSVLGLIRAVIVDKLSDLRPVHFIIKMRINQYHEALMSKQGTSIAKIMRVSVMDKRLKPITESTGPPLKELIAKKQKMMERFNKWDTFWAETNRQNTPNSRVSAQSIPKLMEKQEVNQHSKMVIVSGHELPSLMETANTEDVEEEEDEPLEIENVSDIEETSDPKANHSDSDNVHDNDSNSKTTKKANPKKPIAVWTPFQPPITHNNYYLKDLKEVALANRCVGLRKLQTSISQHPDTKEHEYEEHNASSPNHSDPTNSMCYIAREHAKRFEMVMDKLIDHAI